MSERYLLNCLSAIFDEMCEISSKTTRSVDVVNLELRKKILYKIDYFMKVNELLINELNKSKLRIEGQICNCSRLLESTS